MVCVLGDYYVKSVLCGVFFVRPHLYVFFSLFLSPPRGPLWVDTLDSLSWALVFGRESFVLLLIVLERLDLTRGGEGGVDNSFGLLTVCRPKESIFFFSICLHKNTRGEGT